MCDFTVSDELKDLPLVQDSLSICKLINDKPVIYNTIMWNYTGTTNYTYMTDAKAIVIENIVMNTHKDPLKIITSDHNLTFDCEKTDETVQ